VALGSSAYQGRQAVFARWLSFLYLGGSFREEDEWFLWGG
jgi:hypothetical protein